MEWISVKDRLPEDSECGYVCRIYAKSPSGAVLNCDGYFKDGKFFAYSSPPINQD